MEHMLEQAEAVVRFSHELQRRMSEVGVTHPSISSYTGSSASTASAPNGRTSLISPPAEPFWR